MNERIALDPQIQHGQPVIKGTRVPITAILSGLAGGMTTDQIAREYDIAPADIEAALTYAAELIEDERAIALR